MKTIDKKGSLMLGIASILIFLSIFFPWWGMKLTAPQYPEGLYIIVYPYKMTGNLDIINNLNHYIGMAEFSESSFPELSYLSIIISVFAVCTSIVALLRKRKLLLAWIIAFVVGGAIGIIDIYRWLHKFGTELDPRAPIKIPPFVPPIIGTNKLANFHTLSYLSYGAVLAGIAFLIMIWIFWRSRRA